MLNKKPRGLVRARKTWDTPAPDWPVGAWIVPSLGLFCISSNRLGWEHVSVSVMPQGHRLPTWDEMVYVKNLFWDEGETVIQIHPPKAIYIDNAQVLHLWRPIGGEIIPVPSPILTGLPGVNQKQLKQAAEQPRQKRKRNRHGR